MANEACPRCGSRMTTVGLIASGGGHGAGVFTPSGLRWWSFRLRPGVPLRTPHAACLSCGLVWSDTAPEQLRAFIEKFGTARGVDVLARPEMRESDPSRV
jgi:hypothetical protein